MVAQAARPPIDRIAASIRRERERTGLSLSELARSAGVAKSTLSQLESGSGNPSPLSLRLSILRTRGTMSGSRLSLTK